MLVCSLERPGARRPRKICVPYYLGLLTWATESLGHRSGGETRKHSDAKKRPWIFLLTDVRWNTHRCPCSLPAAVTG